MMNENELKKLKEELEESRILAVKMASFCAGKDCNTCILRTSHTDSNCMACLARKRLKQLEDLYGREHKANVARNEAQKTIEDMHKAMLTVKRDDWDIVNICYAEDDTTVVAFIKKGTPLKSNMNTLPTGDIRHTQRTRFMAIARELTNKGCANIVCRECPFFNEECKTSSCLVCLIRNRLTQLDKGGDE